VHIDSQPDYNVRKACLIFGHARYLSISYLNCKELYSGLFLSVLCVFVVKFSLMLEHEVQQEQDGKDIRQYADFLSFAGTEFETNIG
jgi:hypothetical protein